VDAQARVNNAEKLFEKIRCKTNWLSCKPLLTHAFALQKAGMFKCVVIGGSSAMATDVGRVNKAVIP
jgi:hypothetical protein